MGRFASRSIQQARASWALLRHGGPLLVDVLDQPGVEAMIFDYPTAAKRAGIPEDKPEPLRALVRAEFPSDEMMAELHILRAILSIERGDATLDEILAQEVTSSLLP